MGWESGGGGGVGGKEGGIKVNRFFNSSAGNFSVFVNCLKSAGAHCAGKQQSHYSMILIVDKELFLSLQTVLPLLVVRYNSQNTHSKHLYTKENK